MTAMRPVTLLARPHLGMRELSAAHVMQPPA